MVEVLSYQFQRRLGTIFIEGRHVKVIDEDETLFAISWTEDSFSDFLEFIINDSLCLIG